jgi:hypothetical protein
MADEKYTDENAASDFNAGFTDPNKAAPLATKTEDENKDKKDENSDVTDPPENKDGADTQDPPADGGEGGEGGDGQDPPADGADEVVTLKKADFDRMMAAVDKVDGFDQKFNKVFGTTGSIQKTIKELQAATPKGFKVELPTEAIAAMKAEYPEMTEHLEKILSGIKGTGEVAAAETNDDKTGKELKPEAVANIVADTVTRREMEVLEDEHPKWRDIVGVVDSEGKFDEKNPFRVWLGKQSADYRDKINKTNSPLVVSKAIDKFQAALAAEKAQRKDPPPNNKQAASRKERIAEGAQPKGGANPPPTKKSADDEFNEGFRTG